MPGSMTDLAARMEQRKQRLQEEQAHFERKKNIFAQNPDAASEPSELGSARQPPKPKQRRQHRSSNKSPFDDDSSLQFDYTEKKSGSTATTSSSTPRQPNKFMKKPTAGTSSIPVATEKLSVTHSPRDIVSPRRTTRPTTEKKSEQAVPSSTGLLAQSTVLARAVHRHHLFAKGIELEPGEFDEDNDEDDTSSDMTTTSGAKLFGAGRKSFLKKPAGNQNQVPELQHLNSETINSERESKKHKHKKHKRPTSALDTEDDSSLDIIGDGSISEGRKTPTSTPRSILKTSKANDFLAKESERSVQFSERLVNNERVPSPTKTPRRVQIAKQTFNDDIVPSETESISTAIDVDNENEDISSNEYIHESPVDNMFANLIINDEPLVPTVAKKKSPRRTSPTTKKNSSSVSPVKYHRTQRTISKISDDDNIKTEEIPEEINTVNYSEDFSPVPTESSTPRSLTPTNLRPEKPAPPPLPSAPLTTTRKVTTDDQQVQVDLMSAPFQSSLNQVHSIYLINQNDLNDVRPSSLIRSVVEPDVLQSLLTTNPVLLAVDDLIREQSSLLRSFIQIQRTYYESTVRSIRPDHIYVTKDNTLQLISDQQRTRMYFQPNDDSITN